MIEVKIYKAPNILSKTLLYSYDGLGRRIARLVTDHLNPSKSYSRKFIYDGDNILAILDESNNFIAGYLQGESIDEPMAVITDADGDGELNILSLVKDHQNSVKLVLDESKKVVQQISYSAYGVTEILNLAQDRLKLNNLFYYTSRELEAETGDYYYRARYYDPSTGRFLTEDKLGFNSGDLNFYRYVLNNPIGYSDPTGNNPLLIIGGIIIGFLLPPDLIAPDEVYDPNKGRMSPPHPYPEDNSDLEREKQKKKENEEFKNKVCSV